MLTRPRTAGRDGCSNGRSSLQVAIGLASGRRAAQGRHEPTTEGKVRPLQVFDGVARSLTIAAQLFGHIHRLVVPSHNLAADLLRITLPCPLISLIVRCNFLACRLYCRLAASLPACSDRISCSCCCRRESVPGSTVGGSVSGKGKRSQSKAGKGVHWFWSFFILVWASKSNDAVRILGALSECGKPLVIFCTLGHRR